MLQAKYRKIKESEVKYEALHTEDAEVIAVAFGSAARIASSSVRDLNMQASRSGCSGPLPCSCSERSFKDFPARASNSHC